MALSLKDFKPSVVRRRKAALHDEATFWAEMLKGAGGGRASLSDALMFNRFNTICEALRGPERC